MRWLQTLLLPALGGGVALLAGALAQQPAGSTPRPPEEKKEAPPRVDPEGAKFLEKAAAALAPNKHPWVETTLWQQVDLQGLSFQVEGKYLSAPDNRIHLDLRVHLGNTLGRLEVVSDGTTLWEGTQIGKDQPPDVQKMALKKVLDLPSVTEQVRADFLQRQSFAGVGPLLKNISQQMAVTGTEAQRWRNQEVVRLTAFWKEDVAQKLVAPKQPWPAFLPRKCYLCLGAQDPHWPYRIEWWGPAGAAGGDALLLQMEFRNPRLDQPLPEERLQREFTFHPPDPARVRDLTAQVTQQLAGSKKK